MHVYGSQLAPLLETLVRAGGMDGIGPTGSFHARALWRGSLRGWLAGETTGPNASGGGGPAAIATPVRAG